jgi:amidase
MSAVEVPPGMPDVENATIYDLEKALESRRATAVDLVKAYQARVSAYDQTGPRLNAVREENPDAVDIARSIDASTSGKRRPLEGIPIFLKDSIATGDKQHTTAGSLALADAHAHQDATVVKLLRDAGAVILGKTNLTEFGSVLTVGMPSGYSSIAGQVRNPYAPELDEEGIPVLDPGGSSSGSAVAVAAGFAAAAIGTETSGSLLFPASQNGVVTVKPTVGLISCAGVVPIDRYQDTVGPLTRTVRDAATLLNVLAACDPEEKETRHFWRPDDYTSFLDREGLRGARVGIPFETSEGKSEEQCKGPAAVIRRVCEALEDLGATLVRGGPKVRDWRRNFRGDNTVLNLYPSELTGDQFEQLPVFHPAELKQELNAYLHEWIQSGYIQTITDIIAFNNANTDSALRFGQSIFLAAEHAPTETTDEAVLRCKVLRAMHAQAITSFMDNHQLDAVLFPGYAGAGFVAKAGFPSVQVPAGMVSGVGSIATPDYPFGVTFTGRAWSEAVLLRLAYAFEQGTRARIMPPLVPPLPRAA